MDSWDCSDAGDSGWTMYLDHSSSVSLPSFDYHNNGETKQEQDEDSSMVSDASSGPPYYCEEVVSHKKLQQNTQYWCKNKNKNTNKVNEEKGNSERFNSCLHDTASSLPFGEEALAHKQYRDQYQQSYSTRRVFKGKFNSSFLQQAFPVDKLALDHQGGNIIKGRGEDK